MLQGNRKSTAWRSEWLWVYLLFCRKGRGC